MKLIKCSEKTESEQREDQVEELEAISGEWGAEIVHEHAPIHRLDWLRDAPPVNDNVWIGKNNQGRYYVCWGDFTREVTRDQAFKTACFLSVDREFWPDIGL